MLQQDDLLMQKIELTLDMQNKKVLAELAKVREEVSLLREEVVALKKARPAAAPSPATQPASQPPTEKTPSDATDKPIDRNGVAPSEVSIEKMFYFGNKR